MLDDDVDDVLEVRRLDEAVLDDVVCESAGRATAALTITKLSFISKSCPKISRGP